MESSALKLIITAGPVVKVVLGILLFFSVVSWAIIFYKYRHLATANKQSRAFLDHYRSIKDVKSLFAQTKRLAISPIANVFRAVYTEGGYRSRSELRRAIRRYETLETAKLEKYLNFLATTGSTTPFIGLFGTVWGIMNSFLGIQLKGTPSLDTVAPGIAEALIATAMGLAAAIPAVIAYNYYLSRARQITIEMEDFSEDILDLLVKESDEDR